MPVATNIFIRAVGDCFMVLKLLAQGYTNKEVGTQLCLSVKTIETYRARIVDKLGLRSRADLTRYALEMGLLNPVPSSPG